MNTAAKACIVAFAALMLAAVACGARQSSAERAAVKFAEPRFPSYHFYPLTSGHNPSGPKPTEP